MIKSCRKPVFWAFLALLTCAGCASFWHDLQPHRLKRLNRHPPPAVNPEFSQSHRPARNRLVRLEESHQAEMSANSAEIVLARGQTGE
jgi:predicted component of type VI protein secretion system